MFDCDFLKSQTARNLSHNRCLSASYFINGIGMQRLATMGYEHFVNFIEFVEVLLRNGRNNYKKMQRYKKKNMKLRKTCKKYGNSINKKYRPRRRINNEQRCQYSAELRLNHKIDKNIAEHAAKANKSVKEVLDSFISYKFRADCTIFDENRMLTLAKQKEYQQLQKKSWDNFKNDASRITNLMFNYTNRNQSFRDIQGHRLAV